MVKSVIDDITTYYPSVAYQVKSNGTDTNTRKYYSFNGATVALQENGVVTWLLHTCPGGRCQGDQVNSTTITANADGSFNSEIRYSAYGEVRYSSGTTVTDKLYTGQQHETEIGLDYYIARFYDPVIGHFIQPDSLIPQASASASYDRYAYVNGNPVNFNDPSGHRYCDTADGECNSGGGDGNGNSGGNTSSTSSASTQVSITSNSSLNSYLADVQTAVFSPSAVKITNELNLDAADAINTISGPTYTGTILDYIELGIDGFTWLNQLPGFREALGVSPSVTSSVYTKPKITGIGINDPYGVELSNIVVMNTHFESINFMKLTYNIYLYGSEISTLQAIDRVNQPINPGNALEIHYVPPIFIQSNPSRYSLTIKIDYWTTNYFGSTTHQITP